MAINLLPKDVQSAQEQGQQQLIATIISIVVLIIVLATIVVTYSFRVFVTRDYDDVFKSVSDLKQQINSKQTVEGTLKAIHLKTEKLTEIFGKNYPYGVILETLDAHRPQTITLETVGVEDQDKISLSGSTSSLVDLALFMKYINEEVVTYKNLSLTLLNFNEQDFTYAFTLTFTYVPSTENQELQNVE